MSIVWREAMNTGDPVIDADHQHLVEMINQFETAMAKSPIDHKKIARVLLELLDYTGEHFVREEALQLEIRYPYSDSHRKSHRDVLKRLSEIITVYTKCPLGPERDTMVRSLAGFLREWLVDHIIHSDLRMTPYIQKMQLDKVKAAKRIQQAQQTAAKISRSLHPAV